MRGKAQLKLWNAKVSNLDPSLVVKEKSDRDLGLFVDLSAIGGFGHFLPLSPDKLSDERFGDWLAGFIEGLSLVKDTEALVLDSWLEEAELYSRLNDQIRSLITVSGPLRSP